MIILSLDQGTTSSRAILFDAEGNTVGVGQVEFEQHFPEPGWVEHDPEEIWQSQREAIDLALTDAKLGFEDITTIGITNQRETTVIWDRVTGKPIHPAVVWQDRRTADQCDVISETDALHIHQTTGLLVDPYFSATKIRWILDHVEGAQERAERGELAFGTIDSWLTWKLSEGASHITDITNASRTMLMHLSSGEWDDSLVKFFNIPNQILPRIVSSSGRLATAKLGGQSIPITGIAGDQQAALFGQLCTEKGMVKNTYGTGCFTLLNTGNSPILSKHKLLTTVAYKIGGQCVYALEGSVFNAGSIIKWLIEGLGIVRDVEHLSTLIQSVESSEGVVFSPALTGLGAPHWDASARGLIGGLTRGSTAAHIARAAVESIALQVHDLIKAMESDLGEKVATLHVDGGVARSNFLMQLQSDLLDCEILRPESTEATARGAAYLAGLGAGIWSDVDALKKLQSNTPVKFSPEQQHPSLLNQWEQAVERSSRWQTDQI